MGIDKHVKVLVIGAGTASISVAARLRKRSVAVGSDASLTRPRGCRSPTRGISPKLDRRPGRRSPR